MLVSKKSLLVLGEKGKLDRKFTPFKVKCKWDIDAQILEGKVVEVTGIFVDEQGDWIFFIHPKYYFSGLFIIL
jgi:hypothetical protein